jgi:hypothetical protein
LRKIRISRSAEAVVWSDFKDASFGGISIHPLLTFGI